MSAENQGQQKVTIASYLLLLVAIVIFSGAFTNIQADSAWVWLKMFDFTTLLGKFGAIAGSKNNFQGVGGTGARNGFLFAINLCPSVILALGIVKIVDGYGGLLAAEKIIRPFFRPLLGIPGILGLAFITHLQSTDGSAAMAKELFDGGQITDEERTLFTTLMLSGDGTITNYFATIAGLFQYFTVPIIIPLVIIFLCKIMGTNIMRFLLKASGRKAAA
ncbi:hypothetical protein LJC23_01260 [Desulfovibrio sp. OttesenSCG-928-I05]|nr:hypothetical protein [Desulfovibrio sp. OttesenSCG-928-I05]